MSETEGQFPLDTFSDAAPHLRRPFTSQAVKFKVQATWPKDTPTGGLIVSYIDARLVVERLNLIIPGRWSDHYDHAEKGFMWCHLTVDGITRSDVGEGTGKGLVSDALKRAAVKFGIGVSLYAVPKMILNVSDGYLKSRRARDGATLELTPNGLARVRDLYAGWLDTRGVQAFGQPLDHGDAEGAQGDIEADDPPPVLDKPNGTPNLVNTETMAELRAAAKGLKFGDVKLAMTACGIDVTQVRAENVFSRVPADKAAELARMLAEADR